MNNKSQLKKFIAFLKKEHIYEIYLRNLTFGSEYRQRCAIIKEKDMVIWLTETVKSYPHRLIEDAFSWGSPDGVNWIEINEKWKKTVCCVMIFTHKNVRILN
jgi:hypothetical protein